MGKRNTDQLRIHIESFCITTSFGKLPYDVTTIASYVTSKTHLLLLDHILTAAAAFARIEFVLCSASYFRTLPSNNNTILGPHTTTQHRAHKSTIRPRDKSANANANQANKIKEVFQLPTQFEFNSHTCSNRIRSKDNRVFLG